MNLLDALRQAEQQGKDQVHRGAEKLHKVETAIRRKIKSRTASPSSAYPDPEQEREVPSADKARTGIVSLHGRDVEQIRCTGGRH
jgi:hypothetical protein